MYLTDDHCLAYAITDHFLDPDTQSMYSSAKVKQQKSDNVELESSALPNALGNDNDLTNLFQSNTNEPLLSTTALD